MAGLQFPNGKIFHFIKQDRCAKRVGTYPPISRYYSLVTHRCLSRVVCNAGNTPKKLELWFDTFSLLSAEIGARDLDTNTILAPNGLAPQIKIPAHLPLRSSAYRFDVITFSA